MRKLQTICCIVLKNPKDCRLCPLKRTLAFCSRLTALFSCSDLMNELPWARSSHPSPTPAVHPLLERTAWAGAGVNTEVPVAKAAADPTTWLKASLREDRGWYPWTARSKAGKINVLIASASRDNRTTVVTSYNIRSVWLSSKNHHHRHLTVIRHLSSSRLGNLDFSRMSFAVQPVTWP